MDKNYISLLIRKFFGNDLPEETQYKFRQWLVESESQYEKRDVLQDIWENDTANQDKTTREDLKKVRMRIHAYEKRSVPLYKRVAKIAVILVLPLIGAAFTYYLKNNHIEYKAPELVECFVPHGEQRQVVLPDGSEVWLNAGSLLIYEKEFNEKTRTLFLNGEANFTVAKDPDKPFIVKTEYMDIEALGTVFNIQSYPETDNSIATLAEGSIRVHTKNGDEQSVILSPNEQLVYNRISKVINTKTIDASRSAYWTQGFLIFQSDSFEDIVRTIERKFGVTVNYEVNKFIGRTFTVRFSPDEEIDQVLGILKDIGEFNYKIKGNMVFIITK